MRGSTPIRFRNRNLRFVPFVHGANQLIEWVSSHEGVMPFRPNESEHPHINYRNIPLRGAIELRRVGRRLLDRQRQEAGCRGDAIFLHDHRAAGRDARLLRRLADSRSLGASDVARLGANALGCLRQWAEAGWLHVEAKEAAR